jgi:SARP family transcriptional regulator, regulator of embCAB operon
LEHQPGLRIQLCGRVAIDRGGERLEPGLPGRQGRRCFVYLAANRARPVARDELAAAVWEARPPPAADAALSALTSKLRRLLGADALPARGDLQLVLPAGTWIDFEAAREAIHRAEAAVACGAWARAWSGSQVALHAARRGLLSGDEGEWIDELRRELDTLHLRALEAYGEAALGLGGAELAAAERAGRALVRMAPYREVGHRLLMRALVARDNPAEALVAYEDLRVLLRDELGIAPSGPTQELHLAILGG